ncbi:hypothetical protein I350_02665 [Cryptococcus amylolentus CBS 6273]|uniref:Uncharacterized protein n=1 Tax=Cryptococcus amylolentus CBS 6273 TaxID=1296118 RepID=A0A1E3K810_9TREE|nr:hypothetical protein I350_02665 [Cryptococcus amylolentus CBS 6273]
MDTQPPVYVFDAAKPYASLNQSSLSSSVARNFWRSARWCIDGSAILSTTEDRALRVHQLSETTPGQLTTASFPQPDSIVSSLWFPTATLASPETFCFAAAIRDSPLKLIDGITGVHRASYPIMDHRERFVAPHSLAFNTSTTKIYCGFQSAIEIFDVANPGHGTSARLKTSASKASKDGQRGIISALSFNPDGSGLFAAGSYDGSVALYQEDGREAVGWLDGVEGGGVTQLGWHPLNSAVAFVSSRRSRALQVFDLRYPTKPLIRLDRDGQTNQRIWFDVDPWGRWVASGDQNGYVRVWDIVDPVCPVVWEQKLYNSAVGSVQFHPFYPLLLSCSGSRQYLGRVFDSDSDISSSDSESGTDDAPTVAKGAEMDPSLSIHSFIPSP